MANPKRFNIALSEEERRKMQTKKEDGLSCEYEGKTYPHGSVINQKGVELKCRNGKWEPLVKKVSGKGSGPGTGDGYGK